MRGSTQRRIMQIYPDHILVDKVGKEAGSMNSKTIHRVVQMLKGVSHDFYGQMVLRIKNGEVTLIEQQQTFRVAEEPHS